jgi:uncharacterized MAPEG superfamily protein
MSIPFLCVFLAFLLNLVSKAPVAVAMARRPGGYDNRHPRDQQAALEGWGRRAVAAHLNGFEAFPAFASAVFVAVLAGGDPAWAARLSVLFVLARALYLPLYVADVPLGRSAVWTVGLLATCALFVLPILA